MKARVRRGPSHNVIAKMSTMKLHILVRQHMNGKLLAEKSLWAILEELVRRREKGGFVFKSNEDAWAEFQEHYMPLTPSPGGKDCMGNGAHPGLMCLCPDCDYFETICFPDWKEQP